MTNKLTKTLSNNVIIPSIGLGTWQISNDDVVENVIDALNVGYRHIDTAQAYDNEEGIGRALKKVNLKREDYFITSKVRAEIKNYLDAKESIYESLKKLDTPYIDLMLIHCPQPWDIYGSAYRYEKENLEVWKALEEAYNEGIVRAIGVSNFNESDLKNLFDNASIKPMVNQIQVNILNKNEKLVNFCKDFNIIVEAYCPNAHGEVFKNEDLINQANTLNVSISDIALSYCLKNDLIALPKSLNKEHLIQNLNPTLLK